MKIEILNRLFTIIFLIMFCWLRFDIYEEVFTSSESFSTSLSVIDWVSDLPLNALNRFTMSFRVFFSSTKTTKIKIPWKQFNTSEITKIGNFTKIDAISKHQKIAMKANIFRYIMSLKWTLKVVKFTKNSKTQTILFLHQVSCNRRLQHSSFLPYLVPPKPQTRDLKSLWLSAEWQKRAC